MADPRHTATATVPTGRGATIWFTGLPSAGKSTIAAALAARLRQAGRPVEVLDGDELRATISAGLGFSRSDRDIAVRRAGAVAAMLARHGVLVLAPLVSPYRAARGQVRDAHLAQHVPFVEIHVATGVETCARRDVKGLYAEQRAGRLQGLSGVDDPYEFPTDPELRLDTAGRAVDDCVRTVLDLLQSKGLM